MKSYKPMLAKTAEAPFSSKDWLFELKWDGIRAIAYINEKLSIRSRNQKELKDNFPEFSELNDLAGNVVLDGEIIFIKDGKVDFGSLLKRVQASSAKEIEHLRKKYPSLYVVFDILEKDGKSLLNKSLIERKKILEETMKEGKNVIISEFEEGKGEDYYLAAIKRGLEGIVAKRKNSDYEPGKRSSSWLKIKLIQECDCVIFGFTAGSGKRSDAFGALVLGLYNEEQSPIYIGKVGTGFDQKKLNTLSKKLHALTSDKKILQGVDVPDKIFWVEPELVAKIGYQKVTSDGKLRMPRFLGLRSDKDPLDCELDQIKRVKLEEYLKKRDFALTPEPKGSEKVGNGEIFVVQEHDARHLHYDLRLERNGVLESWAVPKGIPQKAGIKRLAIKTEDHPLEYAKFHGIIPEGQYGAGTVKIWDKGNYTVKNWEENKIEFSPSGTKISGKYVLVRFKKGGEKNWLLMKVGT